MAITMQGNWTVQVKSKAAAFKQRFIIQGSSNGKDGIYDGVTSTAPVQVDGAQWTIQIQHKPSGRGQAWQPSAMRLGTPSRSGGQILLDVFSNDSGGDSDYNDLVLTCGMAETASEYVVYGKVRSYRGLCGFNPCFPWYVIDTWPQLKALLNYQSVKEAIGALYPDRLRKLEKYRHLPVEELGPFTPMMLPTAVPQAASFNQNLSFVAKREIASVAAANIKPELYLDLGKLRDRLKLYCSVKDQAGLLLRFQEYDRTDAELAGGPYTGEGDREMLGLTATDEVGNYVFRFSRDLADVVDELDDQVIGGPDLTTQLQPDLLVQVMGGAGESDILFETGLHANIPNLRRINLCIPDHLLNPGPACQGGRAIQSIGNIWTISGVGNTFDTDGRITATNINGPQITNGAWRGTLEMFACFLAHPEVTHYVLRYRRPDTGWNFVRDELTHIYIPQIGNSTSPQHKVGPFDETLSGGESVPAYKNIESDSQWIATHRLRKAKLNSSTYAPNSNPGPVIFRIDGYRKVSGELVKVAGADDQITLYIDNRLVEGDIASVAMGGSTPGECALFELTSPDAPLTLRFRADHPGGFTQNYRVAVFRGSGTPVAVSDLTPPAQPLDVDYNAGTHGALFFGTFNGVAPDGGNYVVAELQPDSGAWLPADKPFCAFAFEVYGTTRATNGYGKPGARRLDVELIGLQVADA
ncbi:hypothetical protein [Candidatus Leptofilum sp.]|uniref:hypothetical protein n=1 Tax=Candidatus Leptofilum sp. TaxID=3241576 RepID=UPI003B59C9C0